MYQVFIISPNHLFTFKKGRDITMKRLHYFKMIYMPNQLISDAADEQERPQIVTDGAGGTNIAWRDKRTVVLNIYMHKELILQGIPDSDCILKEEYNC